MTEVEYKDYSVKVKQALSELAHRAVEEACGELESQVKRNQDRYRDTGNTTNAWTHNVRGSAQDGEWIGTVGNPLENSIWEELGTGEYALNGDGRKGGWSYKDEQGNWHHTMGKPPRRHFHKAYTTSKNKIIRHIQNTLKGGLT